MAISKSLLSVMQTAVRSTPEPRQRTATMHSDTDIMLALDNAYKAAESIGKTDALCEEGSEFKSAADVCLVCIDANGSAQAGSDSKDLPPSLAQFLDFCNGPDKVGVTTKTTSLTLTDGNVSTFVYLVLGGDATTTSASITSVSTRVNSVPSKTSQSNAKTPSRSSEISRRESKITTLCRITPQI